MSNWGGGNDPILWCNFGYTNRSKKGWEKPRYTTRHLLTYLLTYLPVRQ